MTLDKILSLEFANDEMTHASLHVKVCIKLTFECNYYTIIFVLCENILYAAWLQYYCK